MYEICPQKRGVVRPLRPPFPTPLILEVVATYKEAVPPPPPPPGGEVRGRCEGPVLPPGA